MFERKEIELTELEKKRIESNLLAFMTHVYDWCDVSDDEYAQLDERKWDKTIEVIEDVLSDINLIYKVEKLLWPSDDKEEIN